MGIKIVSLCINKIQPFQNKIVIPFHPEMTLIRGENGAGKTTILEALALFGHVSDMAYEKPYQDSSAPEIQVLIDLAAAKYRDDINRELPTITPGRLIVCLQFIGKLGDDENAIPDLKRFLGSESEIRKNWRVRAGTVSAEDVFRLEYTRALLAFSRRKECTSTEEDFSESLSRLDEATETLKSDLEQIKNEPRSPSPLETASTSATDKGTGVSVMGAHETFAKTANQVVQHDVPAYCFNNSNRSKYLQPKGNVAPEASGLPLPPFIAYINTDMYEWGVGLDVRESPKHLPDDLPPLLQRLGIANDEGRISNLEAVKYLWNKILDGGRILRCIYLKGGQAVIRLRDPTSESMATKTHSAQSIDTTNEDQCNMCERQSEAHSGSAMRCGYEVDFVSSGENQVLTIGLMIGGLKAQGSCLLLDEPDLHLDIRTAKRLYLSLFASAKAHKNQFIAVTHLPLIFADHVCEAVSLKETPANTSAGQISGEKFCHFPSVKNDDHQVGLIFLNNMKSQAQGGSPLLTGKEAVQAAANTYRDELRFIASQSEFRDS